MKMVKSLLLGSAAGLVAVSAGQAADLPVKAKPVEYVKVCSLYGAGFYYIPGTDTCLKLGGFVRTEVDFHAQGSFAPQLQANSLNIRPQDSATVRTRAYLTADVREQTSYGTLRGYLAAGWQYTTQDAPTISLPGGTVSSSGGGTIFNAADNSSVSILRAFIQWGGFTFGKTASFYDFFNTSKYSLQSNFLYQDYAGVGVNTWGYTQQLGNGIAATIAAQDPTNFQKPIVDVQTRDGFGVGAAIAAIDQPFNVGGDPTTFVGGGPTNSGHVNAGFLVPDIVGSIRLDQAWGGAQIAAIAHDKRATQFLPRLTSSGTPVSGSFNPTGTAYPGDRWGWAVQGGIEFNLSNFGWFSKGDTLVVQSAYCQGDSESCYQNSGVQFTDLAWNLQNTNRLGIAWLDDAYFANGTDLQLPTMWNVIAAIQHYWVPEVRTSLYGGFVEYRANSNAVDQNVCAPLHAGGHLGGLNGTAAVSPTGCADWQAWMIGSRTLWNPTKNLDIGVDVLYTQLSKSAFEGAFLTFTPTQGPRTIVNVDSTHQVAGIVRVQYNFYP